MKLNNEQLNHFKDEGYLVVEDNFNPEIGFKRRDNFKQYEGNVRFSPRCARTEQSASGPNPVGVAKEICELLVI